MRPLGKTDHIDPTNALDHFNCTPSAEAYIKLVSTKQGGKKTSPKDTTHFKTLFKMILPNSLNTF